jgi:hypothetical protein
MGLHRRWAVLVADDQGRHGLGTAKIINSPAECADSLEIAAAGVRAEGDAGGAYGWVIGQPMCWCYMGGGVPDASAGADGLQLSTGEERA